METQREEQKQALEQKEKEEYAKLKAAAEVQSELFKSLGKKTEPPKPAAPEGETETVKNLVDIEAEENKTPSRFQQSINFEEDNSDPVFAGSLSELRGTSTEIDK